MFSDMILIVAGVFTGMLFVGVVGSLLLVYQRTHVTDGRAAPKK